MDHETTTCGCRDAVRERRTFLKLLGGVAGFAAAVLVAPTEALAKKIGLKLDKVAKLKKVGGWMVVKIKGKKILLIRDTATSVRATTSICSHKKQALAYDPKTKQIRCTEHGSRFSLAGKVLKGPASKHLTPVYSAKLDTAKNRIIIDL